MSIAWNSYKYRRPTFKDSFSRVGGQIFLGEKCKERKHA